ncbi:hypothetical protein, partial [Pseudomonas sp. PS01299]|uniref:hypothetical protein n=1 Tax=Pseudomonas sp. PS01299 TaxID=2991435 RepID=UPI00249AFD96
MAAVHWSKICVGDYQSLGQKKPSEKDFVCVSNVSGEWLSAAPPFASKLAPTVDRIPPVGAGLL